MASLLQQASACELQPNSLNFGAREHGDGLRGVFSGSGCTRGESERGLRLSEFRAWLEGVRVRKVIKGPRAWVSGRV